MEENEERKKHARYSVRLAKGSRVVEFEGFVRNHPSPFGKFGKITSKSLGGLVGKKVGVTVKEKR